MFSIISCWETKRERPALKG